MSPPRRRAVRPSFRERLSGPAAASVHSSWTVLCDFDGTITRDITDSLLLRFARPGWEALEHAWHAGRIGSRECMAGQIALLDCSPEELDEHLAQVEIDPGFEPFIATVVAAGARACIVSDGLDFAIDAILARHGIDAVPVFASRLAQTGPRAWRLEFPHARPGCASATCKCARALAPHAEAGSEVLVIGDGESDVCVAAEADLVFARGRLLEHCRAAGLPHRRVDDFAQALRAWRALHPPSPGARVPGSEETLDA